MTRGRRISEGRSQVLAHSPSSYDKTDVRAQRMPLRLRENDASPRDEHGSKFTNPRIAK